MASPLYNTKRESLTFGLWFLIISLAVLAPVMSIGSLLNDLAELERSAPDVTQAPAFKTHMALVWASVLIETALGITIAVMLYKMRVRKTLTTACILLWAKFAIGFALMLFVHSSSGTEVDASITNGLTQRVSWLILWTCYLLLSKKVQAIYP